MELGHWSFQKISEIAFTSVIVTQGAVLLRSCQKAVFNFFQFVFSSIPMTKICRGLNVMVVFAVNIYREEGIKS